MALARHAGFHRSATHLNAENYIRYTREAAQYFKSEVAPLQARVDKKLEECVKKDYEAWQACRAAAECRGDSPDSCGKNPQER